MRGRVLAGASGQGGRLEIADGRGRELWVPDPRWAGSADRGHDVSVVWLVRPGRGAGPFVLIQNHSTGELRYNDAVLARLHRPDRMAAVLVIITLLVSRSVLGLGLAVLGGVGWWLAGVQGARALKASGRLLGQAQANAGRSRVAGQSPSATTSRRAS